MTLVLNSNLSAWDAFLRAANMVPRSLANAAPHVAAGYFVQHPQVLKSFLCNLPVELRLTIYRMLLRPSRPLQLISHGGTTNPVTLVNRDVYPSILRTCKLFNQEAAQVLYGENLFQMNAWCLAKFANRHGLGIPMGSTNAASIRFLKIQYDVEKLADLASDLVEGIKPRHLVLLHEMPGLEEIVFHRYDGGDLARLSTCCVMHHDAAISQTIRVIGTTSRILIAALQDIVENQLTEKLDELDDSEHGTEEPSQAKIFIGNNRHSVRLAIKGNALQMKPGVSTIDLERDIILLGRIRHS